MRDFFQKSLKMACLFSLFLLLSSCGEDEEEINTDVSGTWIIKDADLTFLTACGSNLSDINDPVSFNIPVEVSNGGASLSFSGESDEFSIDSEKFIVSVSGSVVKDLLTFTSFQFKTFGDSFPGDAAEITPNPITTTATSIPAFNIETKSENTPECLLVAKIPNITVSKTPGEDGTTDESSGGDSEDASGDESSGGSSSGQ